jgi:hypothetical protein
VDRSWQALDSVLPQEKANSEANQAKSGDVVSRTEKIVSRKDRHDQWGQSTKDAEIRFRPIKSPKCPMIIQLKGRTK